MSKYKELEIKIKNVLNYLVKPDSWLTVNDAKDDILTITEEFIQQYSKVLLEKVSDNVVVDYNEVKQHVTEGGYLEVEHIEVYAIKSSITDIELPKIQEI